MIAKLRGVVDTVAEDFCIIDVNGVGYLVFASSKTLSRLNIGNTISLMIETIVREDSISLFGFADALEKEWFNTLTKVQGVGAESEIARGIEFFSNYDKVDVVIVARGGAVVNVNSGGKDNVVLAEESKKMVDSVNQKGGCAKLTIYPEKEHDAWSDTYSNRSVYLWLLSHLNCNTDEITDISSCALHCPP